jgi:hypothetical protein
MQESTAPEGSCVDAPTGRGAQANVRKEGARKVRNVCKEGYGEARKVCKEGWENRQSAR